MRTRQWFVGTEAQGVPGRTGRRGRWGVSSLHAVLESLGCWLRATGVTERPGKTQALLVRPHFSAAARAAVGRKAGPGGGEGDHPEAVRASRAGPIKAWLGQWQ